MMPANALPEFGGGGRLNTHQRLLLLDDAGEWFTPSNDLDAHFFKVRYDAELAGTGDTCREFYACILGNPDLFAYRFILRDQFCGGTPDDDGHLIPPSPGHAVFGVHHDHENRSVDIGVCPQHVQLAFVRHHSSPEKRLSVFPHDKVQGYETRHRGLLHQQVWPRRVSGSSASPVPCVWNRVGQPGSTTRPISEQCMKSTGHVSQGYLLEIKCHSPIARTARSSVVCMLKQRPPSPRLRRKIMPDCIGAVEGQFNYLRQRMGCRFASGKSTPGRLPCHPIPRKKHVCSWAYRAR